MPVETTWGGSSGWASSPGRARPRPSPPRARARGRTRPRSAASTARQRPFCLARPRSAAGPAPVSCTKLASLQAAPARHRHGGAERGMAGEGQLLVRVTDPVAVVGALGARATARRSSRRGRVSFARASIVSSLDVVGVSRPRRARCPPAAAPRRRPARRSGGSCAHDRDRAPGSAARRSVSAGRNHN